MNNNINNVIECKNITKTFNNLGVETTILKNINLNIKENETIAILGASGSGKSTLLNILGTIDIPTTGECFLVGNNINNLSETKICKLRNKHLGFIYQFHHLMNEFSAIENVALPLFVNGVDKLVALDSAKKLLAKVQLEHRVNHKPQELSGGERQRVAMCRAIINNPNCLLTDEPTGNLDKKNAEESFELMLELNRQTNCALVIVTHDSELVKNMDKIFILENGQFRT